MIKIDNQDNDLLALARYVVKTHPACRTSYVRMVWDGVKPRYLHRVVMERILARKLTRAEKIDHINGDGLDCRRSNLRLVTHSENLANRPGWRKSSSPYKGVTWNKANRNWEAKIMKDRKTVHLGRFSDEADAARAYDAAAMRMFSEHAWLNFRA